MASTRAEARWQRRNETAEDGFTTVPSMAGERPALRFTSTRLRSARFTSAMLTFTIARCRPSFPTRRGYGECTSADEMLRHLTSRSRFGYHEHSQVWIETAMKNIFRNQFPLLLLLLLVSAPLWCAAADAPVNDVLRPPKGAKVAIVVFEDLQCPQCRRVAPILEKASEKYKIPLVRHDFPLPMHNWSYNAAVMARYFDGTSKELGNEFRDYIFSK